MSEMEMLLQAEMDGAANILFAVIVLTSFGVVMMALMFSLLLLRAGWRWLMRYSWGDVVGWIERRALR
jgi:hypothetical protein